MAHASPRQSWTLTASRSTAPTRRWPSLTLCEVNAAEGWFNLMLIAHTQKCIVIPLKKIGDRVNLEADCLGKYAASAVQGVNAQVSSLEKRLRQTQMLVGVLAVLVLGMG